MSSDDYHWCEGYLAALSHVLGAEGASMEDWTTAKTIAFDVYRGEHARAAARLQEIAERDARFRGLADYVRGLASTGGSDPKTPEPEQTPGFEGVRSRGGDREPPQESHEDEEPDKSETMAWWRRVGRKVVRRR